MAFLRWLGGIVVFVWLLGFLFNFLGESVHILLLVAAAVFLTDWFFEKRTK
jgi:hypothetical protein